MERHSTQRSPDGSLVIAQVSTAGAPTPGGPYSQAVAAGDLLFLSGQRPVDPETGEIPAGVTAQTRAVLRNLAHVLTAGGSAPDLVVKVTVHLADIAFFDEFNAVYSEFFAPPFPARTTVGSSLRGILVEVDAIAVRSGPGRGALP